jgi:hypothetical protein
LLRAAPHLRGLAIVGGPFWYTLAGLDPHEATPTHAQVGRLILIKSEATALRSSSADTNTTTRLRRERFPSLRELMVPVTGLDGVSHL